MKERSLDLPPANASNSPLEALATACGHVKIWTSLMKQPAADRDARWEGIVLNALRVDIPRLLADAAEDLFPILELRARRKDDIENVLARLRGSQEAIRASVATALNVLEAYSQDRELSIDMALTRELAAVAIQMRYYVSLLSAIVLPIARLRLMPEDLYALGAGMAARRAA
jgi:hypothetical protein